MGSPVATASRRLHRSVLMEKQKHLSGGRLATRHTTVALIRSERIGLGQLQDRSDTAILFFYFFAIIKKNIFQLK